MATEQSTMAARVAANNVYQSRVSVYMSDAAVAVMNEPSSTPHHTLRVAYAQTILDNTASVPAYATATMSNPVLFGNADLEAPDQGIDDTSLEFAVTEVYNAMAGAHEV